MTMKSLKYSEREDMMEGFSPVPPPLPRRQPVRNIYAEPFVDPSRRRSQLAPSAPPSPPPAPIDVTAFNFKRRRGGSADY